MGKIAASLRLIRLGNCLMAAVSVLVGVRLAGNSVLAIPPFLAALGTFFVCAAGNIHNDVMDLAADRISHPKRELVRGTFGPGAALYAAFACNAVALFLAASVNHRLLILAFGAIVLLALYNVRLKKIALAGNITVAALGGLVLWTGGFVSPDLSEVGFRRILVGSGLAFFLHLIREIIKDICDMDGDAAVGVKTLPHYIGVNATLGITLLLGLLLAGGTAIPILFGWFAWPFAAITLVLVDLPLLAILNMVWFRPTPDRFRFSAAALKVAMGLGLLALIFGV